LARLEASRFQTRSEHFANSAASRYWQANAFRIGASARLAVASTVNDDIVVSALHASTSHLSRVNEPLGIGKFSVTQFLIALGMLIFATPFIDQPPYGEAVEAVVMTIVLLSGALAVGGRRRMLSLAMSLSAMAIIAKWVSTFSRKLCRFLVPTIQFGFMGLLIYELTRYVLHLRRPSIAKWSPQRSPRTSV
jgi:hypothetical protein